MIIYPAIDLRKGRCVRLRQGDPEAETVFGEDPVEMARHWVAQGAEWLHVVNLDGAFGPDPGPSAAAPSSPPGADGGLIQRLKSPDAVPTETLPINLRRLRDICRAVDVPVQFGGGLRSLDDIQLALSLGASRVVLGTVAVKNPNIVHWALEMWGADKIAVGIDARDGMVATHGWQETSHMHAVDLGHTMRAMGVKRVIYTDISRDGMLSGVNVEATAHLGNVTDLRVIASGGVASIRDIEDLKKHEFYNVEGVIVGQAIYTGNLDLAQAIEVGHRPLTRHSAGILPMRHTPDGVRVLLLWNACCEAWQFPRGTVERGEDDWGCARREFTVATGLTVLDETPRPLPALAYVTKVRTFQVQRTVAYHLAEVGPGDVHMGCDNHGEALWVSLDEAAEMLAETSPEQLPLLDAVRDHQKK